MLSRCVEAIKILILTLHHADINIANPQRMGDGEKRTNDNQNDVASCIVEQEKQNGNENDGQEHGCQLDR